MKSKKVKIVATIGPASNSAEIIEKLAVEGVDVFRLNLSHQKEEDIANLVKIVRDLEKKLNKPLAVMGDLGGLKIRTGEMEKNTYLTEKEDISISTEPVIGSKDIFSINYPAVISQLKIGTEILLDDGRIKLIVTQELAGTTARAKIEVGGLLSSHKGFYAEDILLSNIGVPEKDEKDIRAMVNVGADALAVSFVQTHLDILQIREKLPPDCNIVLIAKIETKMALENIEKIIEAADGIMIARGDLGLAVPIANVPILQKKLISDCLKQAKPVITATQMLESMTRNPLPTRAEVTDVANAILDGTDAIMLSDETAVGKHPLHTVEMMRKIIEVTTPHIQAREYHDENEIPHAVSSAAGKIAEKIGARLILAFTQSGFSALQIARQRNSHEVIVALTPSKKTLRKLCFCWGVYPKIISATTSFDHALQQTKEFIQDNTIIKLNKGEPYVIITGLPYDKENKTNLIHVEVAE